MAGLPHVKPDMNADEETRMRGLIETLSAYIEQYHGGIVQFLEYDDQTLVVEMGGACVGCPLSTATLRGWIEGNVRQFFPDIKNVVGVEMEQDEPQPGD